MKHTNPSLMLLIGEIQPSLLKTSMKNSSYMNLSLTKTTSLLTPLLSMLPTKPTIHAIITNLAHHIHLDFFQLLQICQTGLQNPSLESVSFVASQVMLSHSVTLSNVLILKLFSLLHLYHHQVDLMLLKHMLPQLLHHPRPRGFSTVVPLIMSPMILQTYLFMNHMTNLMN